VVGDGERKITLDDLTVTQYVATRRDIDKGKMKDAGLDPTEFEVVNMYPVLRVTKKKEESDVEK
jgi:hypothetical protein